MNMDELLKNIYGDFDSFPSFVSAVNDGDTGCVASLLRQSSLTLPKTVGNKTVDGVWKEIVEGSGGPNQEQETVDSDFDGTGELRDDEDNKVWTT
ncbi:unnamed protein product [Camellia sinensis]